MKNSRSILKTFFYFVAFLFLLGLLQYFFNIFDYFYKKEGFGGLQGDALIGVIVAGSLVLLFAIISFFVYKRHKKGKNSHQNSHVSESHVRASSEKRVNTEEAPITKVLKETAKNLDKRGEKLSRMDKNTSREKNAATDFNSAAKDLVKSFQRK